MDRGSYLSDFSQVDIVRLSAAYSKNGFVSIDGLFQLEELGKLNRYLRDMQCEWFRIVRFDEYQKDCRLDDPELPSLLEQLQSRRLTAKLAYSFERTLPHNEGCGCELCGFWETMLSSPIAKLVEQVSGHTIERFETYYATRFKRGDFLTVHTDPHAKVGFVLNLTEDWRPDWGGLLHITDRAGKTVLSTLTPALGMIFLFEISRQPVPHFVSEVCCDVPRLRTALTGRWL